MLNWAGTTTERLRLDRPTLTDLPSMHALHADPRTNQHNPAGPVADPAQSRQMLDSWLAHWEKFGFGYWIVRDHPDDQPIGAGGLRLRDGALNLYYRFAVAAWGHGYATELATQAVRLAARDLPGTPVVAIVHPDNIGSRRVAERAGLHLAGRTQHNRGTRLLFSTEPSG